MTRAGIDRRGLIGGALVAGMAGPLILTPGKAKASDRLVVVNWGGTVAEAKRQTIYEPFTRETGIPVLQVQGPDLAKLKVQVRARDVEWDVVEVLDSWVPVGEREGLFEPIDLRIVDPGRIVPAARREKVIGTYFYGGCIAQPLNRFPPDKCPGDWRQFWDVVNFPGRRGLRKRIGETLEIALMADGVAPKDVYPCDVDRAFRALDRLKAHVTNWIAQTPQTVTLIQNNECDFTYTYASRAFDASRAGLKIGRSSRNNIVGLNWLAVPRGAPNRDAAMRLAEFFLRPDRQIALCNLTAQAPVVPGLVQRLDEAVRPWVPDPSDATNLVLDIDWWAGKADALERRFQEWLLA